MVDQQTVATVIKTKSLSFGIANILKHKSVKSDSAVVSTMPTAVLFNPFSSVTPYHTLLADYRLVPSGSVLLTEQSKALIKTKIDRAKELPRRIGHPYQSRAPPKHKKLRTLFTKEQIACLEARFDQQKYLASEDRLLLAAKLQMSDSQIKTWFQNRRTKWRRQEAEEKESAEKVNARLLYSQLCLNSDYHTNEQETNT